MLIAAIIDSYASLKASGGWNGIVLIVAVPAAIGVFLADFFTRVYFKDDVKRIWVYELIIISIAVIILVSSLR